MVLLVRNVQIACTIDSDTLWIEQHCIGGHAVIAAVACAPVPSDSGNKTRLCVNSAHTLIVVICNVEISGAVHGNPRWVVETGRIGKAAVAAIAG